MKFGLGQSPRRLEDRRFLSGKAQFTANLNLDGQLHAAFLRSPMAHAKLLKVDSTAAQEVVGIVAVLTSDDLDAASLGTLPCLLPVADRQGQQAWAPPRPWLARDAVHYVGEPIAMVLAESPAAARDGVEAIVVELEPLPFTTSLETALDDTSPLVWPQHKSNLSVHWQNGDAAAVGAAMATAHRRIEIELVNNRVVANPMEPRCCLASYDRTSDRFTLYTPSQGPMLQRLVLSRFLFKKEAQCFRVIARDTGGGFGVRGEVYAETCLTLWAAETCGRPVKWSGGRSDTFLSDNHGRDNITRATLAFDESAHILALRISTLANMGAYLSAIGPFVPTMGGGRVAGTVYRIPHLDHSVRCVFTNTVPTGPYRGAGRPEASYLMERLLDKAAQGLGVDSIELRRRNLIRPDELPYRGALGSPITSGDFPKTLELALDRADWQNFDERRHEAAVRGKLRGIGLGYYIESSGGRPEEEARVEVGDDGDVALFVGTYSHGQGHETALVQVAHEVLGIDPQHIHLVQGDTEVLGFGNGTGGSRSAQMGGVAVLRAAHAVVDKGRRVTAHVLGADQAAVEYEGGEFRVRGEDGTLGPGMTLKEVAAAAGDAERLPAGMEPGLREVERYDRGAGSFTFPNGCHIAEVEVDPETGAIEIVRFTAIDDCGNLINPMLAHGQVHGGIAQGAGQALLELAAYDADSGQLVSGSFLDYAMPRSIHFPGFDLDFHIVPEPNNDLGVKGIGEGGACGAPPAIVNAVLDALRDCGVDHLDMPLFPEKVWQALKEKG